MSRAIVGFVLGVVLMLMLDAFCGPRDASRAFHQGYRIAADSCARASAIRARFYNPDTIEAYPAIDSTFPAIMALLDSDFAPYPILPYYVRFDADTTEYRIRLR